MDPAPLPHTSDGVGTPAAVTNIELAREQRDGSSAALTREVAELQSRLETERSAGKALLAAVRTLEQRLETERLSGQALLAAIREIEAQLVDERRLGKSMAFRAEMLHVEVLELDAALTRAQRPLWRRVLGR